MQLLNAIIHTGGAERPHSLLQFKLSNTFSRAWKVVTPIPECVFSQQPAFVFRLGLTLAALVKPVMHQANTDNLATFVSLKSVEDEWG